MNAAQKPIRLYEITVENGLSTSPYVWRIHYALAHKGLASESVAVGFTELPNTLGGRFKTVPIIEHGDIAMAESWDIAEYLDSAFPGTPPLFSGESERATLRLFDTWFSIEVMKRMFGIYVLDIHNAARPADRSYFRTSREARFFKGATLETITADRAARLPEVRNALTPLRLHLKRFPFLGGSQPNFGDYIALGAFRWIAAVSSLPLLAADDSLRPWIERGFDLYGGIARNPKLSPLFEG
jgi:glutathione S-transferase